MLRYVEQLETVVVRSFLNVQYNAQCIKHRNLFINSVVYELWHIMRWEALTGQNSGPGRGAVPDASPLQIGYPLSPNHFLAPPDSNAT